MFVCPFCGDMVPEGARACPGCGSDEQTGWSQPFMADEAGFDPDLHERESGGWLNVRKHPVFAILFMVCVAVLILVWIVHILF